MQLHLPRSVFDAIRAHARDTYPEECCGFLIGRDEGEVRVVTEARPTRNVHPGPRGSRYAIDNEVTRKVEGEFRIGERRLLGFYHSHPDYAAVPSDFDVRNAWEYYVYAVLTVRDGEPGVLTAWLLEDERRAFREVSVSIGSSTSRPRFAPS